MARSRPVKQARKTSRAPSKSARKPSKAQKAVGWIERIFGKAESDKVRKQAPSKSKSRKKPAGWIERLYGKAESNKVRRLKFVPDTDDSGPKPPTWAESAERARERYQRELREERRATKERKKWEREELRLQKSLAIAEKARLKQLDKIARQSEDPKFRERVIREQRRAAAIALEYPGCYETGEAIQLWLDRVFLGSALVINRDGSIDSRLDMPFDEPEQLLRALEGAWPIPPGCWIRIGWRFDIDPDRSHSLPADPNGINPKTGGKPFLGQRGYDGLAQADVLSSWKPPGKELDALIVAADEGLAENGTILGNMLQPFLNHRVQGAVIEIHWNPEGEKPDRL